MYIYPLLRTSKLVQKLKAKSFFLKFTIDLEKQKQISNFQYQIRTKSKIKKKHFPRQKKKKENEIERGKKRRRDWLGFWGLPSAHFETEKWTFSRARASALWGSLRQFLTRLAQMLEYVMYVIPAALQNGTAAVIDIFFFFFFSLSLFWANQRPSWLKKLTL